MTDLENFEGFMKAYQDMVYSTAIRMLGSPSDAQDISQEVFLKAYQHFSDLAESPTAGGWLKKVATNLCLNHLTRYRARWRFFSELASPESEDEAQPEFAGPQPEQSHSEAADHRELLEKALQKLPAAQRVPLVLFHFEDMSYEQIAAKLRVSLSKVKTDIHRGRQVLRRLLSPEFAPPPERFRPGNISNPLTGPGPQAFQRTQLSA